jgi:hypothetical protein
MHFSKQQTAALAALLHALPAFASPIPGPASTPTPTPTHDNLISSERIVPGLYHYPPLNEETIPNNVISSERNMPETYPGFEEEMNHQPEATPWMKHAERGLFKNNKKTTTTDAPASPKTADPATTAEDEPADTPAGKKSKTDKFVDGAQKVSDTGSAVNGVAQTGNELWDSAKNAWNDVFHNGESSGATGGEAAA